MLFLFLLLLFYTNSTRAAHASHPKEAQYDEHGNQIELIYEEAEGDGEGEEEEWDARELAKYWHQRYRLFSRFDFGVRLDKGMHFLCLCLRVYVCACVCVHACCVCL